MKIGFQNNPNHFKQAQDLETRSQGHWLAVCYVSLPVSSDILPKSIQPTRAINFDAIFSKLASGLSTFEIARAVRRDFCYFPGTVTFFQEFGRNRITSGKNTGFYRFCNAFYCTSVHGYYTLQVYCR